MILIQNFFYFDNIIFVLCYFLHLVLTKTKFQLIETGSFQTLFMWHCNQEKATSTHFEINPILTTWLHPWWIVGKLINSFCSWLKRQSRQRDETIRWRDGLLSSYLRCPMELLAGYIFEKPYPFSCEFHFYHLSILLYVKRTSMLNSYIVDYSLFVEW